MPINVKCPKCGTETVAADQYAGTSGPCRNCGEMLAIPGVNRFADGVQTPPNQVAPKKSNTLLIVLGALLVMAVLCGGVLVALLVPAVSAARDAATRNMCMNNLRQVQLAVLNYESANQRFPPAYSVDENGKPMHSWRVLILPYLDTTFPLQDYRMDEPWDSQHNLALSQAYMPEVYRCAKSADGATDTDYLGVGGPQGIFGPEARKMSDIMDGTSRTLAVVEANGSGVHWAEPRDWDPSTPLNATNHRVFHAAFADCHIEAISSDITQEQLQSMATVAGGEPPVVTGGGF